MPRPKGALGSVYDRLVHKRDLALLHTPCDRYGVALYNELIAQYESHDEDVAAMNKKALEDHHAQSPEYHECIRKFNEKSQNDNE